MPAPTNLPSSFASAAAGQNPNRDRTNGRGDSRGSGSGSGSGSAEWPRRDGRSNGTATLTFRRASSTPFNNQPTTQPATDNPLPPSVHLDEPGPVVPQSLVSMDSQQLYRYSREQLLEWAKNLDSRQADTSSLLMPGFVPGQMNGNLARPWGKPNDAHTHQDPTICWDAGGNTGPLGLEEMSPEEKELFATDVNSALKQQQQQQQNKDAGQGGGMNGRKTSVSHAINLGLTSPLSATRPATRRRETTDTNPFPSGSLTSPTASGAGRFDQPWFGGRRGAEAKEVVEEPQEEQSSAATREASKPLGFAALTRSNTSGGGGFGGTSLWGASSTTPSSTGMGAFGNFAMTTNSTVGDKGFGSFGGSQSRFARLITKDSSENVGARANEGASVSAGQSWRPRPRTDTDPFGDEGPTGSAALGGARDTSPPPMPHQAQGAASIYDTPAKGSAADLGMSGLNLGGSLEGDASASPSQTNPFRSPPADRGDNEHGVDLGLDKHHSIGGGNGGHSEPNSNFGSIGRGFASNAFEGSDRSQTSSVGAKAYNSIGNIWPTGPSAGTPDRERAGFGNAFGTSLFSPLGGELQSPGLGGLGSGIFGPAGAGGLGASSGSLRGSKLGSLFPPAMQAQMHQGQDYDPLSDSVPDLRQSNPHGAIGRSAVGTQPRETGSPLRTGRNVFDELLSSSQPVSSPGIFTTAEQIQTIPATASQGHAFSATAGAPPPFGGLETASDMAASQTRTMVMPDRMRWVYLDPQHKMQGPFSGLDMNEWYKANFFSPDLRVRKLEDPEFEPLGVLIRRIGNSREPFLVPQVGIPHGPPSQHGPFSPGGDSRGVIPPLVGVVPAFGRTLTAEEQNNLERRKQEEQFMMARQREFMAQQSHLAKIHGAPGALHHHSSAHSLQSQPSFGSMTSPIGMPPQAPIGALGSAAGFFEHPSSTNLQQQAAGPSGVAGTVSDALRGDLSEQERQMLASLHGPGGISGMFPPQPVGAPSADLRSQLPTVDQLQKDPQGFKDRLKEFQEIRATRAAEEAQSSPSATGPTEEKAEEPAAGPAAATTAQSEAAEVINEITKERAAHKEGKKAEPQAAHQHKEAHPPLSLTQQVQKAQAAAAAAAKQKAHEEDAWAKHSASTGLPMPFPPPPPSSSTPLPAPTAQRRSNIPELHADSRSQSATPDSAAAQPPPLAPWAGTETHKGPSLKEIQELEAKKAAKQEAARRAAMEQEAAAAREREKAVPVVPGLPTSSTWGSGSPVSAGATTSSPWSKPNAVKSAIPGLINVTPGAASGGEKRKKTLAEIQREEEARKQKAVKEQAAQAGAAQAASSMGKRYADLASKGGNAAPAAAPAASAAGGGWATVGAGGKVKVPTGPAAQARSASTAKAPPAAAIKPVAGKSVSAAVKNESKSDAQAEFRKWVYRALSGHSDGPNGPTADVESLASTLLVLPLEVDVITDGVYSITTTLDARHFAEEFIRRKKLADKGIVEKIPADFGAKSSGAAGGGWSEVAKKGSSNAAQKEAELSGPGFKVVDRRGKKGKK